MRGATFAEEVNLTGARIAGEMQLGPRQQDTASFRENGRLILRNTSVGALQDRFAPIEPGWLRANPIELILQDRFAPISEPDSWPRAGALELDGFTYQRLGGGSGDGEDDMIGRGADWYVGWLARDTSFSNQPYWHLAKVLREAGEPDMADAILYAARDRARAEAAEQGDRGRWLILSLSKWTIGYGLGSGYFLILLWIAGFTLVGAIVLWCCQAALPEGRRDLFWRGWASFDQLLPVIELDEVHASMLTGAILPKWAIAYFYVHKLVGYGLGFFLIAGLAGLTQKG